MSNQKLTINYQVYNNISELPDSFRKLLKNAKNASKKSWSPYSQFKVGAALQLSNGMIITGNNQENVAFPSGICAERVALNYATANYPDIVIESLAVTAQSENFTIKNAVTPCGGCRQVIAEVEKRQNKAITIICSGMQGKTIIFNSISDLLPFSFKADELKK